MTTAPERVRAATPSRFEIPSLDGVRALAVTVVFIGHAHGVPAAWPGDTGVTIFFFLSGFLITTLLRRERERTDRIALGKFYLRRLLRIQPPAWLAVGVALALAATGVLETAAPVSPWGVVAELGNWTNYWLVFRDGASGLPPETSMLWSLGVEEHYYLLFPVTLILLTRRLDRVRTGVVLLAVAGAVTLWRCGLFLTGSGFYRLYVSTDTRIDVLLVGSAVALLANPALGDRLPAWTEQRLGRVASVAAVVFAVCGFVYPQVFSLTVAFAVEAVCLVPVFWWVVARPASRVGRVLNHPVVARVGVWSFSIYLFHRMALGVTARFAGSDVVADLLAVPLTLGVAALVWFAVEEPCRRLRQRLESRALPVPTAAVG